VAGNRVVRAVYAFLKEVESQVRPAEDEPAVRAIR